MKSYIHAVDESDRNSLIATQVQNFMGSNPRVRGNESTNKTHVQSRITLECFFLEVFPSANFTSTIRGWGDPDNADDVEFHPMTYPQLQYLLTIMTADVSKVFEYQDGDGNVKIVHGRGYGEGMIKKIVQQINYLHVKGNCADRSPCKDLDAKRWIQSLKNQNPSGSHQAPSINYVEALPALFNAIWHNDEYNFHTKVQYWCIILFFIWFAARPVEVADYCPYMEHVKFPTSTRDYDADGLPTYIEIGFRDWKWRKQRDVQAGPYYMIVWRNYLSTKYCLLFWLLTYLKYADVHSGPIFRTIGIDGKAIQCHPRNVDTPKGTQTVYFKSTTCSHGANLSKDAIYEILNVVFNRAGYPKCSGYTFRRSSVKWWRVCGAQEWEIKNGGRWHSFFMHATYLEEGPYLEDGISNEESHPIRKLWVWKPNTRYKEVAPELNQAIVNRR